MPKGQTRLKGPIVAGTGKAQIAAEGGGKKALKTWRSLPMASRKILRGSKKLDITATMKNIRTNRAEKAKAPGKTAGEKGRSNFSAGATKTVDGAVRFGSKRVRLTELASRADQGTPDEAKSHRRAVRTAIKVGIRGNNPNLSAKDVRNRAATQMGAALSERNVGSKTKKGQPKMTIRAMTTGPR